MYHFCTYFDQHYLARGLTLYRSLVRHARPFVLYVLCLDNNTRDFLSKLNLRELVTISLEEFERGDDALIEAKKNRSLIEYYFTCTPSLPLYVLNNFPNVNVVTYLDADLFFYANPAPIYEEFGDQSILIVEHRFPKQKEYPPPLAGIYNVSFLAFRNDIYGRGCLNWWRERCLEWCYDRVENGRYADQKYLDDWPIRFQRVMVLQNKGAGLAPWNVVQYSIRERDGSIVVDSDPLIFYHFHNLKILNSFLFDHGLHKRKALSNKLVLRKIYIPYLQELQDMILHVSSEGEGNIRTTHNYNTLYGLLRLMIYFKPLILLGPIATEISLEPLARPLLSLRKLIARKCR